MYNGTTLERDRSALDIDINLSSGHCGLIMDWALHANSSPEFSWETISDAGEDVYFYLLFYFIFLVTTYLANNDARANTKPLGHIYQNISHDGSQ